MELIENRGIEFSRFSTATRTDRTHEAMEIFKDNNDREESELEDYKSGKVKSITNLLQWWDDKKLIYPNLYEIARCIHSISASSAAADRVFSTAGMLCSSRPHMQKSFEYQSQSP